MRHFRLQYPIIGGQRIWLRACFSILMILLGLYGIMKLGGLQVSSILDIHSCLKIKKISSQVDNYIASFVSPDTESNIISFSGKINNTGIIDSIMTTVQEIVKSDINTGDVSVSVEQITPVIMGALSMSDIHQQVRKLIIQQLVNQGFTGWIVHPWSGMTNGMLTSIGTGMYDISYPVESTDGLDILLQDLMSRYAAISLDPAMRTNIKIEDIIIRESDWHRWSDIYLFKNATDLYDLGYEIVSHRTRINNDKEYRRFNIMTAFAKMGNVVVLNPGQEISYLRDIQFDNGPKKVYKYGLSIIGDEEISDYGGGICGSSTALYQGILTNMALHISQRRNHTRRYSNLYPAIINGQYIKTPGIDSALYGPSLDLNFTNIRSYPVIIVANYDGSVGGNEEVFSLAYTGDRGSFEYLSSYKTSTVDSSNGTILRGGCYLWKINGVEQKSCYKKVI